MQAEDSGVRAKMKGKAEHHTFFIGGNHNDGFLCHGQHSINKVIAKIPHINSLCFGSNTALVLTVHNYNGANLIELRLFQFKAFFMVGKEKLSHSQAKQMIRIWVCWGV